MLKYFLFFFFLFIGLTGNLYSQTRVNQTKINEEFNNAVNLYKAHQLDESLLAFDNIINSYDLNTKTTASYFFKIKILIEKKQYEEATRLISDFMERFPTSEYIDEIRILAAKISMKNSEYTEALKELGLLIEKTNSVLYKIEAKDLGEKIARNFLKSYQIKRLSDTFTDVKAKPFMMLLLAKAYLKENDL